MTSPTTPNDVVGAPGEPGWAHPDVTPIEHLDEGARRLRAFARALPKTDLHCHLIGTVRPSTFVELAQREGLDLPAPAETIFPAITSVMKDLTPYAHARVPIVEDHSLEPPKPWYSLFQASAWVLDALATPEDLTRIVREAFQDAHASGTRHLELFYDAVPPRLTDLGYAGTIDAYARGIRWAEEHLGMSGALIAGIDRSQSGEAAVARVREVLEHPHPDVVGVGLDNLETAGPPERFVAAYRLAGEGGLKRTAHSSEHAPVAANTITCLDDLGCDRIDHGYFVLQDDAVVARCREEGTPFTVISSTSRRSWRPWRRASIGAMKAAGLNVILASDDPGMFPTTLADEYTIAAEQIGFTAADLRATALAGVAAAWVDDARRAELTQQFTARIDELENELLG